MGPRHLFRILTLCAVASVSPLRAELPEGARQMIDTALAGGDDKAIATVFDLARKTWPEEKQEIAALEKQWKAGKAERAAQAKEREEAAIRTAGLFDRWDGQGELGGFQSSGNSDTVGIAAGLKLKREGIDWSHLLTARFDYQRQSGVTSRDKLLASYEPRWQLGQAIFAYGLTQYDHDRRQGIDGRYAISAGLGYKLVDRKGLTLSLKAGPAYRITDYADQPTEESIAALAGFDFDWKVFDRLTVTQDANAVAETGGSGVVIVDGSNTTLNLITGLNIGISDRLRARMSYQVDYDSNPPAGKVSTDTLTRATLIYDF